MRLILFICSFWFCSQGNAQFFRASIEPFAGMNYYHSVRKVYEFEPYGGVEAQYGLKAYAHFGNNLSLTGGFGGIGSLSDGELFGNVTAKFSFLKNYQTGFSVFTEAGLEITDNDGPYIPFYLGTSQYFGNGISFNFRVRVPTFLDVKYFYDVNHFKTGVEFGLQFDLIKMKPPDPLTRNGNPFILL
jgi:hypothetical protein